MLQPHLKYQLHLILLKRGPERHGEGLGRGDGQWLWLLSPRRPLTGTEQRTGRCCPAHPLRLLSRGGRRGATPLPSRLFEKLGPSAPSVPPGQSPGQSPRSRRRARSLRLRLPSGACGVSPRPHPPRPPRAPAAPQARWGLHCPLHGSPTAFQCPQAPASRPGPCRGDRAPAGLWGQTLGGVCLHLQQLETPSRGRVVTLAEVPEWIQTPSRHPAVTRRDHLPVHPTDSGDRTRRTGRGGRGPEEDP